MPTRSYYFPSDFIHLDRILQAENDDQLVYDVEYYSSRKIPPLLDENTLALFLGISTKKIFAIRRRTHHHYRSFTIKKKDKSYRDIDTPRTYLKVIQWWILDNILNNVPLHNNIFGFVRGRSSVDNAFYHQGAKHVLNVDIENFFPSINLDQVFSVFCEIGYNEEVSLMLAEMCCLRNVLPQGAPTSPAIANLVMRKADEKLLMLAELNNIKYSRYADDLTFSSLSFISESFLKGVDKAIQETGFSLKVTKTRFAGSGDRMEITGVVINDKVQPCRSWRKNTRARLHRLELQDRLTRRELNYLYGIVGISKQYSDSSNMTRLSQMAKSIMDSKSHTVIGRSENPVLPNKLTIKQAKILALLVVPYDFDDIAKKIGIKRSLLMNILRTVYAKINVNDRYEAEQWAIENL